MAIGRFRIILSFCVLFYAAIFSITAKAADDHDFVIDGICFSVTDFDKKEVEVAPFSRQKGENDKAYRGDILIPSSITIGSIEFSVVRIGSDAFSDCSQLQSVIIPQSVSSVEAFAFKNCLTINRISIPNSVKSIGSSAFEGCVCLSKVEIAPDGVSEIANAAFRGCVSLKTLSLPQGVVSIGAKAFAYCTSLEKIEFAHTIKNIEECAFSHCYGLQELQLPMSIETVASLAFEYCYGLVSVEIPASLTTIGNGAFRDCLGLQRFSVHQDNPALSDSKGLLMSKDKTIIYASCGEISEELVIPNTVEKILDYAFVDNNRLTIITMPKTLRHIGKEAFAGCRRLSSIEIPNTVNSIGKRAFADTQWFNGQPYGSLVYAGSVAYAFKGEIPTNLELKEGTVGIADGALANTRTESVVLPSKMIHIGNEAFRCTKLYSVELPKNVTEIGDMAFAECKSLQVIRCKNSNPPVVEQNTFLLTDIENCTLFVPKKSKSLYDSHPIWSKAKVQEEEK